MKDSIKGAITRLMVGIALVTACLCGSAFAQFNSGSTGADGALDLATMSCTNCWIQLPESGILNYTTVNVPSGKHLMFKPNSRNTPVILLAQGEVVIRGILSVSTPYILDRYFAPTPPYPFTISSPGPGGYFGGGWNQDGMGPGGGNRQVAARWVGPLSLSPLVGGSGGFGQYSYGGGGGAGAVLIASTTRIRLESGAIYSISGWPPFDGPCPYYLGSGGAIRLVAPEVVANSPFALDARSCGSKNPAADGFIRIETANLSGTSSISSTPPYLLAPINADLLSGTSAQLSITSVGGFSVPSYANARFGALNTNQYDLLLPNQIPDPISVVVHASNVPTGSRVDINILTATIGVSSSPCTLSGTVASSTCTATIANLNRGAATYLMATVSFSTPGSLATVNPTGNDQVAMIKMESPLGGAPRFVFMRKDGSVIEKEKVPRGVLQAFGM